MSGSELDARFETSRSTTHLGTVVIVATTLLAIGPKIV